MAETHVNGVDIAWQQFGAGPDLVFVHGLAANRAFWFQHYALPLSRTFRITLFDLRGHGYSSRPQSGYDAVTIATDLSGLIDSLDIEKCALVGHSYGGAIALEYSVRHPSRVSRLVLMDTKVNRLQPEQKLADSEFPLSNFELEVAAQRDHDWRQETQIGLAFLEILARWRVRGGESKVHDPHAPFGQGRGALRTAQQWLDLIDHTTARTEFVKPGATAEAIAALAMPLLLMYGECSHCMPSCRALQALLADAQVEIVAQGGHFFPISHAKATARRLGEFLGVSPS